MDFNKKLFLFAALIIEHYPIMVPTNQLLPTEMCKQAEEMRRVWEARE